MAEDADDEHDHEQQRRGWHRLVLHDHHDPGQDQSNCSYHDSYSTTYADDGDRFTFLPSGVLAALTNHARPEPSAKEARFGYGNEY